MSFEPPFPLDRHLIASAKQLRERLQHHRETAPCSLGDYVQQKRRELACELEGKRVIYFDTNAWKCLSDFLRGKSTLTRGLLVFSAISDGTKS